MIFVKSNNLASAELRANQIADSLGAKVYLNELPDVPRGTIVVFVKNAKPELVRKAHLSGCKVIFDPIDQFAYIERHTPKDWYEFVDCAIAYNKPQAELYRRKWFKDAVVIPHQWDIRLANVACRHDEFRPGYIGYSFNVSSDIANVLPCVTEPSEMLKAMPSFNCHVSIRDGLQSYMKPATKLVNAAAVGAVCITTRDASVIELLPEDYPYWCSGVDDFPTVLERAKNEFNGPVWGKAREMMLGVKQKTSLDEIAKLYGQL
jgi:hypothetical protein